MYPHNINDEYEFLSGDLIDGLTGLNFSDPFFTYVVYPALNPPLPESPQYNKPGFYPEFAGSLPPTSLPDPYSGDVGMPSTNIKTNVPTVDNSAPENQYPFPDSNNNFNPPAPGKTPVNDNLKRQEIEPFPEGYEKFEEMGEKYGEYMKILENPVFQETAKLISGKFKIPIESYIDQALFRIKEELPGETIGEKINEALKQYEEIKENLFSDEYDSMPQLEREIADNLRERYNYYDEMPTEEETPPQKNSEESKEEEIGGLKTGEDFNSEWNNIIQNLPDETKELLKDYGFGGMEDSQGKQHDAEREKFLQQMKNVSEDTPISQLEELADQARKHGFSDMADSLEKAAIDKLMKMGDGKSVKREDYDDYMSWIRDDTLLRGDLKPGSRLTKDQIVNGYEEAALSFRERMFDAALKASERFSPDEFNQALRSGEEKLRNMWGVYENENGEITTGAGGLGYEVDTTRKPGVEPIKPGTPEYNLYEDALDIMRFVREEPYVKEIDDYQTRNRMNIDRGLINEIGTRGETKRNVLPGEVKINLQPQLFTHIPPEKWDDYRKILEISSGEEDAENKFEREQKKYFESSVKIAATLVHEKEHTPESMFKGSDELKAYNAEFQFLKDLYDHLRLTNSESWKIEAVKEIADSYERDFYMNYKEIAIKNPEIFRFFIIPDQPPASREATRSQKTEVNTDIYPYGTFYDPVNNQIYWK